MAELTPQQELYTRDLSSLAGPAQSFLGKYYCRLILGDYERTRPMAPATWNIQNGQTVFLPLPRELSDDTSNRYSEESIEGIGDIINRDPMGLGIRGALVNAAPAVGGISNAFLGALGGAGRLVSNAADNAGITTKNATSALQSLFGLSPNPNPTVLFTGPELRDINFSWAFYPKNYEEAVEINKLIKILKNAALPSDQGKSTGVLKYPKLCQINFFPWDKGGSSNSWGWTDNSIIRIKKCFLSSVKASYSDFGNPAFFHGQKGNPNNYSVTYRLNITFKETEFMLARDWGEGVTGFSDPGITLLPDNSTAQTDIETKAKDILSGNAGVGAEGPPK